MRAMSCSRYGGPEVLELVERPMPAPGPGQLRVRVVASSVNPIDWKLVSGILRPLVPSFPFVPGYDIAGQVDAVGAGVTGFAVGQRVHARIGAMSAGGSAEYALAGVDVTCAMPEGMSYADAAGLPLAGMTALQGLRDRAGLVMRGSTQRVLVVGASGGVGHYAVQIAVAAGATVVGVSSGRNTALVRQLGAVEALDYTVPDVLRGQAPFDIVYQSVGHDYATYLPLLRPGGCFVTPIPGPSTFVRALANPFARNPVRAIMLKSNAADLAVLDELYEAGALKTVVDSRFPLERLADAWERSISGRAVGKVIVDVRADVRADGSGAR